MCSDEESLEDRPAVRPSHARLIAGVVLFLFAASGASAAGDAARGGALFNRCLLCHSNTRGAPNKMGPNLFGIAGRRAGTYQGFSYSAAMKNSGLVWTAGRLDAYLRATQQVVPGNSMPFAGISDQKQRADIVAYLTTLK